MPVFALRRMLNRSCCRSPLTLASSAAFCIDFTNGTSSLSTSRRISPIWLISWRSVTVLYTCFSAGLIPFGGGAAALRNAGNACGCADDLVRVIEPGLLIAQERAEAGIVEGLKLRL